MKRTRPSETLRPLYLKCGMNGQSPGSSYLEQGLTKVVATVYGPRENPRAEGESVSLGLLEVYRYHLSRPRPELGQSYLLYQNKDHPYFQPHLQQRLQLRFLGV